jgi:acyl carrier protein
MTDDDALKMVKEAIEIAASGSSKKVNMDTHLSEEEILDSLDLMTFLFELEGLNGKPIDGIDEGFDDYRVKTIVGLMTA